MIKYIQIQVYPKTREALRRVRGKTGETLSGIVDRLVEAQWLLIESLTVDEGKKIEAFNQQTEQQIELIEELIKDYKATLDNTMGGNWTENVLWMNKRIEGLYDVRNTLLALRKFTPDKV